MKAYKEKHKIGRQIFSMPFIYVMIVPIIFVDISAEMYHRICFPLYGLSYISRKKYIRVDRQKLSYLNVLQKANCMYCGYVNGLFAYLGAIAGATEQYWCSIQHKKDSHFSPPKYHTDFLPYGDEEGFNTFMKK